jgi:SPP1 gp7 family putative phage head morphogenesis protein
MTVNESLRNAGISHAIYLQRYKTSEVNRVIELLNAMDRDLFTRLERDLRPLTRERLERILKDVRAITTEARKELYNRLKDDLKEFAGYESDFQVRKIQSILPITVSLDAIAPAQLWAAANAEVFGDAKMSKYLDGWVRDWGDTKMARVEGMYRRGFAEGRTNQEMVRILRGTKVRGYADGLLEIDRRSAAQITRMATAHVANVARERTFENNRDVIKGVQAVATLDGRTTLICINLDGKVDMYDGSRQELKGKRPPYHWGCRTCLVPVIKSWRELGVDLEEVPEGTRASMNGQIASTIKYPDWLKDQPAAFQEEVLGASRYAMWKNGTPLSHFVDDARVLTAYELKKREAA